MLKNLSIRKKLALLLVGPLLMLLVVSFSSIRSSIADASAASDAEDLVAISAATNRLFDAVHAEAVTDLTPDGGISPDAAARQAETDAATGPWLGLAQNYSQYDVDGLIDDVRDIEQHRNAVDAGSARVAYTENIELLGRIAAFHARVAASADTVAAAELGRSVALGNVELLVSDAQLVGLWAASEGTVPDENLAVKLGAAEAAVAAFNAGVPENRTIAEPSAEYRNAVSTFAAEVPGQLTSVTTESWLAASDDRASAVDAAHETTIGLARSISADAADAARSGLRNTGLLILVGALGAVGLAALIGGQMRSRIETINNEAAAIAQTDLPELATALRTGQMVGNTEERPALDGGGSDEFATLEQNLMRIRVTASEVGKQQTELLQSGISDMFVNLARRNQALVDRQLQVIDELEAEERDPDRLSQMYRVDHLATRMRRNAESLLVLAGHTSPRRRGPSVDLREVVRVAIGEVEDYRRIIPIALDDMSVPGHVAQDLAHLLSELMENATQSSPPGTVADVIGTADPDGSYTIQVIDRGTGIDPEHREELNAALSAPPTNSLVMSRTMGLTVVGRLAKRLGVNISLTAGEDGGTVAVVDLPTDTVLEWRGEQAQSLTQQAIQTVPGQFAAKPAVAEEPASSEAISIGGFDAAAAPVMAPFGAEPVTETSDTGTHDTETHDTGTQDEVFAESQDDVFAETSTGFPSESSDDRLYSSHDDVASAATAFVDNGPLPDPPSPDQLGEFYAGALETSPFADPFGAAPEPANAGAVDEFGLPVFELPSLDPADLHPAAEPAGDEHEPTGPPDDSPFSGMAPALKYDDVDLPAPSTLGPPPDDAPISVPDTATFTEVDVPPLADLSLPSLADLAVLDSRAGESDRLAPPPAAPASPSTMAPPPIPGSTDSATPPHAAPATVVDSSAPAPPGAAAPRVGETPTTTPSGLIKRQRKAPMSAAQASFDRTPTAAPSKRSPDQVKSMLSRYKSGLEKGRTDGES